MPRLTKRTSEPEPEPVPQTDAFVGRALDTEYKKKNEEMAETLALDQKVQFWDEGWRYGIVDALPAADEPKYGKVRILHSITGRVWVDGRDVRPIKEKS